MAAPTFRHIVPIAAAAAPFAALTLVAARDLSGWAWYAWSATGLALGHVIGVGLTAVRRAPPEDAPRRSGIRALSIATLLALLPRATLGARGAMNALSSDPFRLGPSSNPPASEMCVVVCSALSTLLGLIGFGLMLVEPVAGPRESGRARITGAVTFSFVGLLLVLHAILIVSAAR